MPSREGSNLRPLWRFRHALNKQKVTYGGKVRPKDVKNEDRTDYVYENKQNHDKMSCEKSDIYVEVKRILQKIAGLKGRFAANGVLGRAEKRSGSSKRPLIRFVRQHLLPSGKVKPISTLREKVESSWFLSIMFKKIKYTYNLWKNFANAYQLNLKELLYVAADRKRRIFPLCYRKKTGYGFYGEAAKNRI